MIKSLFAAVALTGLLATSAQAAHSGVKVGVLECTVAPGVGLILGSSKKVSCAFKSNGRTEYYHGTTGKLGVDIGFTNKSYLSWVVFAPGEVHRGALAGSYVGASAQATVIAGLGANVLVGGWSDSINLQPLSVQGQTGLNVAAGLASLNLQAGR
ncbi:MAG: DUF992 domain-containing protein [Aestuariivirga sp.]